jgi:hypothetical protein
MYFPVHLLIGQFRRFFGAQREVLVYVVQLDNTCLCAFCKTNPFLGRLPQPRAPFRPRPKVVVASVRRDGDTVQRARTAYARACARVELAGLEPATSWVRS